MRKARRKSTRLDLEISFVTSERRLSRRDRMDLLAWLRSLRRCAGNGCRDDRVWWEVLPTGGRRRL